MEAKGRIQSGALARSLFGKLTQRLSDDDSLLDDVYLHWALMEIDRGNNASGADLLRKALQRSPNSDRVYSIQLREKKLNSGEGLPQ
jgi:hypothetical protein